MKKYSLIIMLTGLIIMAIVASLIVGWKAFFIPFSLIVGVLFFAIGAGFLVAEYLS